MSLRDLNIELSYRSGRNDIVKEFYVPCLSVASSYDRAVGFFTSGGLAAAAKGVASLIRRGGKMRLVASPILSEDDLKDIEEGYEQRVQERITKQTIDVLDNIPAGLIEKRVSCLAWLISVGRLDIKLAFPTRSSSKGVYHEKMGVIKDSDGNAIAFTGSPNETLGGLVSNFESIDVFTTWSSESDRRRVMEKERDFEQLWNDTTRGLRVIDFPDVARERIIALKPKDPPTVDLSPVEDDHPDATRRRMNLREYQQEAIQAWYDHEMRGIISMATGTGKTLVALRAAEMLSKDGWTTLVAVPTRILQDQWIAAIKDVIPGARVIGCSSQFSGWEHFLHDALNASRLAYSLGKTDVKPLFVVATLATAHKSEFKRIVYDNWELERLFIIVDEVHRAGSDMYSHVFDLKAYARMGLSATPKRDWDPEGWSKILDYFGNVVYEYTLAQAVHDGWLSEYEYYVHFETLLPNEQSQYKKLYASTQRTLASLLSRYPAAKSIPALLHQMEMSGTLEDRELGRALQSLLIRRARILKQASKKISRAVDIIDEQDFESCIVYCDDTEQLERIARECEQHGQSIGMYHSGLSSEERLLVMKHFEEGHTRILLAIRCLDEGVDIPRTEGAIMVASDRSKRQFIQRRGRLLRPYKDKVARIHDIFIMPFEIDECPTVLSDIERAIIEVELSRALTFAQNARNHLQLIPTLNRLVRLVRETNE